MRKIRKILKVISWLNDRVLAILSLIFFEISGPSKSIIESPMYQSYLQSEQNTNYFGLVIILFVVFGISITLNLVVKLFVSKKHIALGVIHVLLYSGILYLIYARSITFSSIYGDRAVAIPIISLVWVLVGILQVIKIKKNS